MNFYTFAGAIIISLFTAAAMVAISILLFTADIPAASEKFAILIFGALVSSFGQVTQYWLGSSAEGARKDKAISDVATTATATAGAVAGTASTIAATAAAKEKTA